MLKKQRRVPKQIGSDTNQTNHLPFILVNFEVIILEYKYQQILWKNKKKITNHQSYNHNILAWFLVLVLFHTFEYKKCPVNFGVNKLSGDTRIRNVEIKYFRWLILVVIVLII